MEGYISIGMHETMRAGEPDVVVSQTVSELRDRFAMAALTGLVGRVILTHVEGRECPAEDARRAAAASYLIADAMLAARDRKPTEDRHAQG